MKGVILSYLEVLFIFFRIFLTSSLFSRLITNVLSFRLITAILSNPTTAVNLSLLMIRLFDESCVITFPFITLLFSSLSNKLYNANHVPRSDHSNEDFIQYYSFVFSITA